jgi:hypothetical protein
LQKYYDAGFLRRSSAQNSALQKENAPHQHGALGLSEK